jgi:hypothetical protein
MYYFLAGPMEVPELLVPVVDVEFLLQSLNSSTLVFF